MRSRHTTRGSSACLSRRSTLQQTQVRTPEEEKEEEEGEEDGVPVPPSGWSRMRRVQLRPPRLPSVAADDVLHRFIARGDHALAPSVALTLAPSMDIQVGSTMRGKPCFAPSMDIQVGATMRGKPCFAPSMDIEAGSAMGVGTHPLPAASPPASLQVASNLERYLYHAAASCSADPAAVVRAAMAALRSPARDLAPGLPTAVLAALRADFTSSAADDSIIDATIGRYASPALSTAAASPPYALCPHTATAVDGAEAFLVSPAAAATPPLPTIVLATAHPAKFAQGTPALASRGLYAEVYGDGAGVGAAELPPLPPQLRGLASRPRRCIAVDLPPPGAAEGAGEAAYVRGLAEVQAVVDAVVGGEV